MARHRKSANRRLKKGGRSPLIPLIVTIVLIIAAFFLLEKARRSVPEKIISPPKTVERHQIPTRPTERPAVQKPLSTATKPVQAPIPKGKTAAGSGNVAIIIDDMGSSLDEVWTLMAINVPLSFSIIPGLSKTKEVAEEAHRKGYQVMIHLPMEPQGYPQQRLEKNGLLLSQSDAEITQRINGYFRAVPFAVGANNHMGSRFTEDADKMRLVLSLLKDKGFFFVDSKTSPHSVGYPMSRGMGLETAARDIFLDNVQDVQAIKRQLGLLAATARKRGSAIGICHPHKATMQALAAGLPAMKRDGITFVNVSELVK